MPYPGNNSDGYNHRPDSHGVYSLEPSSLTTVATCGSSALEMQPVQNVSVKDTLDFEDLVGKKKV